MKKRNIFRLFLFLLFVGALVVLFQFIRLPFFPVQSYEAVPSTTSVMLEFKVASEAEKMLNTHQSIFLTDKIANDWEVFKNTFSWEKDSRLLSALRLGGQEDLKLIYVLDRGKDFKLKQGVKLITAKKIKEYSYHNHTIFEIQNSDNQLITVSQFRNLLVFARNSYLVEESISQLKSYSSNFKKQRNFRKLQRTDIGDVAACLYVNFENLPKQLSSYLGLKKRTSIANFGQWVNWVKLGLIPTESGYKCSGAITGKIQMSSQLESLENNDIYTILPDDIAAFTRMEAPLFGKYSSEFQEYFQPWFSGEIAYVNLEPFSAKDDAAKFMVAKCSDGKEAERLLAKFGEKAGKLESYDYQMFHIEQLMTEDILMPVFGKRLNPFKNPFYVVFDEFVIFANSKNALEQWLDKYIGGQTLANSVPFLQAQATQPNDRKVYFSLNLNRLSQVLQNYLQPKHRGEFAKHFEPYKQFGTLSLGLFLEGKRHLIKGEIDLVPLLTVPQYMPLPQGNLKTEIAWKAPLESEAAIAPSIYKSADNGEFIILIQDIENVLYAFSRGGKELWKRQLDGRIISKIKVLEERKENSQKLIFNTKEKVFVCNTMGENIDAFPLTLKSEILNEVVAFDFNQNENYNYFVACKNRNIHAFQEDGTPLPGWSPKKNVGRIYHPIKHLQTYDKDFIFGLNSKGNLEVFKRDGSPRFPKIKTGVTFNSPPDFDANENGQRLVAVDTNGKLMVVNTEGESFNIQLETGSNQNTKFLFSDIIGDQRKDYITLSYQDLSIHYYLNKEFKKAHSLTLNAPQDELFFPNKGIGTLSRANAEINWILPEGELHPDFPLGGTTSFQIVDLFEDEREALVVGQGKRICVYWVSDKR